MKHFVFLLILTCTLSAQTFDVASVRVNQAGSAGGEGRTEESIASTPGSLIMKNVTLRSCLKWAYGLRDFQVSGGPGWVSSARYDISAKAGQPVGDAELRKMLRSLLAERFQLTVREESKELPVYALVVLRVKPELKRSSGTEPAGGMRPGNGALEFRNTSMALFAERLANRPLKLDRPVLDETGLEGGYDFSLKFADSMDTLKAALEDIDRGTGQSIANVIQEQLGLKLNARKAPLPALVIERAVENPGEN